MTPEQRRAEMVAGLLDRAELSPEWREAFERVPRHTFLPDTIYEGHENAEGPDLVPLHRAEDPDRWLELAYANDHVSTQVDDGAPDEEGRGRELTSSASQPAIVAEMLTALRARPGMRVLEIGTGTGWNTALLAYRLGAENVTSIEVDAGLAGHARVRLGEHGFGAVTVVTADGADGWPDGAPYDRVLATVAAWQIPPAWAAQCRDGGEILLPWGSVWSPTDLLRLVSAGDGSASGRIVGRAHFMALRAQRTPRWGRYVLDGQPAETVTDLHPWSVGEQPGAVTAIGLRLPGVSKLYTDQNGPPRLLISDSAGSWARVELTPEPPYPVRQAGRRKLWDEVTTAYQWWQERGEPGADRWRVTVDRNGQRVELA